MNTKKKVIAATLVTLVLMGCGRKTVADNVAVFNPDLQLEYCVEQAVKTLKVIPETDSLPRSIIPGTNRWRYTDYKDWTSGFWPGTLWYMYELSLIHI